MLHLPEQVFLPVAEVGRQLYVVSDDKVAALAAENQLLRAQMSAQSNQLDFYEDCIAEMAAVVYA